MLALSYVHRLPADYPIDTIRERIAVRAPLWNATPGLVFKAFCVRERVTAGASGKAYASVYLWHDAAAALDMLTDETRFGAVIAAFGRPRVETALPLAARTKGDGAEVRSLIVDEIALDRDVDPRRLRESEAARVADAMGESDVLATVSALDPANWRLVRTTLARTPAAANGTAYEVAHLARLGWARLAPTMR